MAHPSPSTPLPLRPIFSLVLGRVAEGATWSVILPYINNQLDSLGISPSLVGTYSGAAESILMITESLVAPLWAKGSDRWGRKRLYLIGLGCHSVFGIIYGFSDHVWQILFWRLMLGTMAGCGVLSRTLLVEVCDGTNVVKGTSVEGLNALCVDELTAFAFLPRQASVSSHRPSHLESASEPTLVVHSPTQQNGYQLLVAYGSYRDGRICCQT